VPPNKSPAFSTASEFLVGTAGHQPKITVPASMTWSAFLKEEELDQIPLADQLMAFYLGFFSQKQRSFQPDFHYNRNY
jgi:hypothetical protein